MKTKLLALVIAGMLGMTFSTIITGIDIENPENTALTPHALIKIDNNGELLAEASSGDGSLGNPYIIENLLINTTGGAGQDAIYVANVTDHFIVRNCTFNDTGSSHIMFNVDYGIRYVNCKADTTDNITVVGNYSVGISVDCEADYVNISNCVLKLSEDFNTLGIYVTTGNDRFLNYTFISDNVISSEICGIHVEYQHLVNISNNILFSNITGYCGMELYNTDNSTIYNNHIYMSGDDTRGIYVDSNLITFSDNNIVSNNIIISQSYSNTWGIYCYQARILVLDSNFIDGFELGIWLDEYTDWTTSINNTIINCTNGLFVGGFFLRTDNIVSYGDSFYNCSDVSLKIIDCPNIGIYDMTSNNTVTAILTIGEGDIDIYGGDISNCSNPAIDISGDNNIIIDGINISYSSNGVAYYDTLLSNHAVVSNCFISNCLFEGVWVEHIYDIQISYNDMSNTGYGVYLVDSTNCMVENNTIYNTTFSGIVIECIDDSIIEYNDVFYCESGIEFTESEDNIISHNNLSINDFYGIVFDTNCNDNEIVDNVIINNSYCGISISIEGSSENNTIYGNWLIDNAIQAYDSNLYNKWNVSYALGGGNYYSDYASYDNYSGANQDIPGADGIGDETYAISGGSAVDYYPLNLYPLTVPVTPPSGSNESNVTQLGDIIFDMIPVIVIISFVIMIITGVNKIYKRKY